VRPSPSLSETKSQTRVLQSTYHKKVRKVIGNLMLPGAKSWSTFGGRLWASNKGPVHGRGVTPPPPPILNRGRTRDGRRSTSVPFPPHRNERPNRAVLCVSLFIHSSNEPRSEYLPSPLPSRWPGGRVQPNRPRGHLQGGPNSGN